MTKEEKKQQKLLLKLEKKNEKLNKKNEAEEEKLREYNLDAPNRIAKEKKKIRHQPRLYKNKKNPENRALHWI